ncbi:MarR family transcriptional regulator [Actinoplanes sp. TBRC 11911]|uniref:MarR family winged helix-turn-helix transcriptional regulator n=1 Tax=Actinoplanes sp. TBRC 11911 TaxID=2729386 RepID=UPI001B7D5868|nr:MarR family transcriptional regulator [Actinoplanes sp. TBRC 11911]
METHDETIRLCYATATRKASRRLTALYDEVMAPSGLRSTQFAILGELAHATSLTINELAELLVMDRSALGHSLRPLQRDGLISLDKDTTDRRSVNVSLTREGRRRFTKATVLWNAAQERVESALGLTQADRLRTKLLGIATDDRLTTP